MGQFSVEKLVLPGSDLSGNQQADKLRALELLGRHVGLFDQKVKVSADDSLTLLIRAVQGNSFKPVVMIDGDKAA